MTKIEESLAKFDWNKLGGSAPEGAPADEGYTELMEAYLDQVFGGGHYSASGHLSSTDNEEKKFEG